MRINRILVPLDGSENAEKIGGWVTGLARRIDAEVALLTVVDPENIRLPETSARPGHPVPGHAGRYDRPGVEASNPSAGATVMIGGAGVRPGHPEPETQVPAFGTQVFDSVLQEALRYVEKEADRLDAAGVKTQAKAVIGDPAEEIVSHSKSIGADMIAMATHRSSSLARGILGSVTDRVLQTSAVPVMALHPDNLTAFSGDMGQPEVIVVPLDGSERSASVLDLAYGIAEAVECEVLLFRAVHFPYYGVTAFDAAQYYASVGALTEQTESKEYLQTLVKKGESRGLKVKSLVVTGDPTTRLIEELESLSSPLVVMSSRGRSGVKRWVLGSVTDKIVRSSGLPVLVVPPKARE